MGTVLDLCANENFVVRISELMRDFQMYEIVSQFLTFLMKAKLNSTQLRKLRDLFMGIILNLACNVDDEQIMIHMI